ncbi:MAG: histidinol-phosphate transaminase [Pseudomonadota bacterium]
MFKPNATIENLSAYVLADLSVPDGVEPVLLAQNEHVFAPSEFALEAAVTAAAKSNLYPDPDWAELRRAIADVHQIDVANILCGAGSMELIGALGQCYLGAGDRVLVTQYGYLYTRTVANMAGATIDIAPEKNFHVDVDALLERVAPQTKMLFLVNPGNPTGTMIPNREIRRLREALPSHVMLIVDEAYAEFTNPADNPPVFDLVARGDTVVLRTFSKIYGLAGMRVGWCYCPNEIAQTVRKVLNPNNVSAPSQAAATAAMCDQEGMQATRDSINKIRDAFTESLRGLSLTVPQSHSNFVLIQFESEGAAKSAFAALKAKGIMLRGMAGYGLTDCLRATTGTEDQMQFVLNTLTDWKNNFGAAQ